MFHYQFSPQADWHKTQRAAVADGAGWSLILLLIQGLENKASLQTHAEDSSSQLSCAVGHADKGLEETGMSVTLLTCYLSVMALSALCNSCGGSHLAGTEGWHQYKVSSVGRAWALAVWLCRSDTGMKIWVRIYSRLTQKSNPWTAEDFQKPAAIASGGTQTCSDIWSHSRK